MKSSNKAAIFVRAPEPLQADQTARSPSGAEPRIEPAGAAPGDPSVGRDARALRATLLQVFAETPAGLPKTEEIAPAAEPVAEPTSAARSDFSQYFRSVGS